MLETRNEDTQKMKQSHFRPRDSDDSVSNKHRRKKQLRRPCCWGCEAMKGESMGVDWGAAAPASSSLLQGSPIKACSASRWSQFRSEDDSQPLHWITLSRGGLSLTFQKGILDEAYDKNNFNFAMCPHPDDHKRWYCVRMTDLHLKLFQWLLREATVHNMRIYTSG